MDAQPLLQYDVAYPERLSRGLIFVKWLLIIPHLIVLEFLIFALYITSAVAWFAILFTGKYPRGMWNFGLMVMRWQARVTAYGYLLQRDEYPPFGDADYPVLYELEYPTRSSRLLIFFRWLLIIPHLVCLAVLAIVAYILLFISWWAILFTGKYPRGMFDFVNGVMRWASRVTVYYLMFTDRYPPFSMSEGNVPPVMQPMSGQPQAPSW